MPLSRKQRLDQHSCRAAEVAQQLEELQEQLKRASDIGQVERLRSQIATLEAEKEANEHVVSVLNQEVEQYQREKETRDSRIWIEQEQPQAFKEINEQISVCAKRMKQFKAAYDDLKRVEDTWKAKWISRGSPRSFKSKAGRDAFAFLNIPSPPIRLRRMNPVLAAMGSSSREERLARTAKTEDE